MCGCCLLVYLFPHNILLRLSVAFRYNTNINTYCSYIREMVSFLNRFFLYLCLSFVLFLPFFYWHVFSFVIKNKAIILPQVTIFPGNSHLLSLLAYPLFIVYSFLAAFPWCSPLCPLHYTYSTVFGLPCLSGPCALFCHLCCRFWGEFFPAPCTANT